MLTLISALLGIIVALLVLLYLYYGDAKEARQQARDERIVAQVYQDLARDERERGDAWMQRALHPDANRTLWDAIDDWLEQERER